MKKIMRIILIIFIILIINANINYTAALTNSVNENYAVELTNSVNSNSIVSKANTSEDYFKESDLENFGKEFNVAVFLEKGDLQLLQFSQSNNSDENFTFSIAERNKLTENTYKSILSAINRIFDNSEDVLNYFKENFPNLSVGSKKFDGFEITVAPTYEEAVDEYSLLDSDKTYKIVRISIDKEAVNKKFAKEDADKEPNTTNITEEKLEKTLNKLKSAEDSPLTANVSLNKETNQLNISIDTLNCLIDYDLTKEPTFTTNIVFKSNMTKTQWEEEDSKSSVLAIPFVLISDIKGIEDYSNSIFYFYFAFLNSNSQMQTLTEHTTAISYAKARYDKSPNVYKDTLFTLSSEKISETSDAYKVKFTLTINDNADFTKINNYTDDIINNMQNSIISSTQNLVNNYKNYLSNEQVSVNNVKNSITKLPQTGNFFNLKDFLTLLIIVSSVLLIVVVVKNIKYKNISKK